MQSETQFLADGTRFTVPVFTSFADLMRNIPRAEIVRAVNYYHRRLAFQHAATSRIRLARNQTGE